MRSVPSIALAALIVSIGAGSVADRERTDPPLTIEGYRVIAADFHIHSSWSNGGVTPWGLVLEAKRQGLDAIAITGHNQLFDSQVGRWFARLTGGPTVLAGEEIQTKDAHLIALGIEEVVDWRQDVAGQIDAVHRQGGVAIAAHPVEDFFLGFGQDATARLDGAEICHPIIFERAAAQGEMETFAHRAPLAAIGSSDFHGVGRLGICRTYVFADDPSPGAILEALREHRTVVYGLEGKAYGDPSLVEAAARHDVLRQRAVEGIPVGKADWISRISGFVSLFVLLVFGTRKAAPDRQKPLEDSPAPEGIRRERPESRIDKT